jgi:hypothetical protein
MKSALLFVLGCSSVPKATEKNPTLFVGKIMYIGSGNPAQRNGISFNGTIEFGVEISIKNEATQATVKATSGKNGLFYTNQIQEGRYSISELFLKKTAIDSAFSTIYTLPQNLLFEVVKGKVNNAGTVIWLNTNNRHKVEQVYDSTEVKDEFIKQFPKSPWNGQEWVNCKLTGDTAYYVKSSSGKDSMLLSVPKTMLDAVRQGIESNVRAQMDERLSKGDTTYYVKSSSGRDSVRITIPKEFPDKLREDMENRAKAKLDELKNPE